MALTYGVAALGRPTFDVAFAEEKMAAAFAALERAGVETVGPRELLFDADAAARAIGELTARPLDALVILQVTFTDATMTVRLAKEATAPVAIWAIPEPRLGGRLRLNAFCGLNLAAHALGRAGVPHGWLYADPDSASIADDLRALAEPAKLRPSAAQKSDAAPNDAAKRALDALRGAKITVVGEHPAGFDTCSYDAAELSKLADLSVETIDLDALFAKAREADDARVATTRAAVAANLDGLDDVDQPQLDRSLRVFSALEDVASDTGARGLAVRCWPETFTEYGCAACGPMAMMNERRTPSACEADVYGSFSAMLLQELADEPVWMADLVDLDFDDDTGVFWHCGLAPLSMCDPEARPEATIHTNRKMPLLHQFPLKPGEFTTARLSQSRGETKLVIGHGEFLRKPMAFTGTSGVMRLDRPAREVCGTIVDEGLEHHYAIAYGDHRDALRGVAFALKLPVLELA
ncbi:MAG: L-fucose/L-arabinose isomerase family protein [Parvularculaceae bacterium]